MNKREYQNFMCEYIDSLERSGVKGTISQWREWIRKEAIEENADAEITSEQIDWIIEALDSDGYVIK